MKCEIGCKSRICWKFAILECHSTCLEGCTGSTANDCMKCLDGSTPADNNRKPCSCGSGKFLNPVNEVC